MIKMSNMIILPLYWRFPEDFPLLIWRVKYNRYIDRKSPLESLKGSRGRDLDFPIPGT